MRDGKRVLVSVRARRSAQEPPDPATIARSLPVERRLRPLSARAILLAAAIAVAAGLPPAAAQDAAAGKTLYDTTCATCHGRRGQENARGQARRLDTLGQDDVRAYLRSRKGAEHPQKVYERIKAALSDAEIDALAAYVASFRQP